MKQKIIHSIYDHLHQEVMSVDSLPDSLNSHVYKVTTIEGNTYFVKKYKVFPGDTRDRLKTEFQCLTVLHRAGIFSIPKAIWMDQDEHIGIYRFVEGVSLRNKPVSDQLLGVAIDFVVQLHEHSRNTKARVFSPASEACFSLTKYIRSLHERRQRFNQSKLSRISNALLWNFLEHRFDPELYKIESQLRKQAIQIGYDIEGELAQEQRTLSPSDFGFHNALVMGDKVTFVDFEYFGWDDPAKLASDFLLHPAMMLTSLQKTTFVSEMRRVFGGDNTFDVRLSFVYPLLGLKWCLIMLNGYLASRAKNDSDRYNKQQLALATLKLDEVMVKFGKQTLV